MYPKSATNAGDFMPNKFIRFSKKSIYGQKCVNLLLVIQILLILITIILAVLGAKEYLALVVVLGILYITLSIISLKQQNLNEKKSQTSGVIKIPLSVFSSIKLFFYLLVDRLFSTKYSEVPRKIELGNSGAFIQDESREVNAYPIINIFDKAYIKLSRKQGRLMLSTKLIGRDGTVAEIEDNEWKINPNQAFDRNYNNSSLEVKDKHGDVVLQIQLLKDRIRFQGKFYDVNGNCFFIGGNKGCSGVIKNIPPNQTITDNIEPIFRYPSNLHFGELK